MNCKLTFILICACNWASSSEIKNWKDAQDYLQFFGYMANMKPTKSIKDKETKDYDYSSDQERSKARGKMNETAFKNLITVFQHYAGLEETGVLDRDTMETMNKPRCGMAERMGVEENKNIRRGMVSHKIPSRGVSRRRGWSTPKIFYKIESYPDLAFLNPEIVKKEINRAFNLWQSVANIRCIEVPKNDKRMTHIDISFVVRDHGDGSAFGDASIGNVVAHAFYPYQGRFDGNIHFDNERMWSAYNITGINLFQVAAHEIGHALGLDHSIFTDSVMHMNVHGVLKENFQLHEDDIKGIQRLYGRKPAKDSRHVDLHHKNRSTTRPTLSPSIASENSEEGTASMLQMTLKDSENKSPLANTLSGFWECFGLSYEPGSTRNATDCYAKNVLNLVYSLQA